MSEWISTKKKLPVLGYMVLTKDSGRVEEVYLCKGTMGYIWRYPSALYYTSLTADQFWMPLPSPPGVNKV